MQGLSLGKSAAGLAALFALLSSTNGVTQETTRPLSFRNSVERGLLSSRFTSSDICLLDNMRFSPDGQQIALYNSRQASIDDPRNSGGFSAVAVFRTDSVASGNPTGRTLVSLRGLEPIGWLSGGELALQQGSDAVLLIEKPTFATLALDDIRFERLDQPGGVSWIRGVGRLAEGEVFLGQIAAANSTLQRTRAPWGTILLSADDAQIVSLKPLQSPYNVIIHRAGEWRGLPRNASITREPQPVKDEAGKLGMIFPGDFYRNDSSLSGARKVLAIPLLDELTGRAIGYYTPWGFIGGQDSTRAASLITLASRDRLISASAYGSKIALLIQNGSRRRLTIRSTESPGHMAGIVIDCRENAALTGRNLHDPEDEYFVQKLRWVGDSPGRRRFANPRYDIINIGADRSLVAQYLDNDSPAIVILFRGGPGGAILDGGDVVAINEILEGKANVLAVSYSGSSDAGREIGRRLARDGMLALREDAQQVKAWLAHEQLSRVMILGVSFGAVPALQLSQTMGPKAQTTYLRVPLLRLRYPSQLEECRKNVSTEQQMRFEEAAFGSGGKRSRFAEDLNRLVENWRSNGRDFIEFGRKDCRSRVSDLPDDYKGRWHVSEGAHSPFDNHVYDDMRAELSLGAMPSPAATKREQ